MSSHWTNKYAIMRDLSMAQGCVPVAVDEIVAADQKPPNLLISEDTEEKFFEHCIGGGDFIAPDLGLITQMLDLVRDAGVSSEFETEEQLIEIRKLNPLYEECGPLNKVESHNKTIVQKKQRKETTFSNKRNVAITSILESIANSPSKNDDDLTVLLNSNEPRQSATITTAVEKVCSWLNSNNEEKVKKSPLLMDPNAMFKKKGNVNPPKQVEKNKIKSPPKMSLNYIPTSEANMYYKKYLEKSQIKSQIGEDIWAKAERQMKEIDAKRKQEADGSPPSSVMTISEAEHSDMSRLASSDARLDIVKLQQHRHLVTGECTVCKVLCEKIFQDTIKVRKM